MSGGHFHYNKYDWREMMEEIETIIQRGTPYEPEPGEEPPDPLPQGVISTFKSGLAVMSMAYVFAERIDYLLAGDDGYQAFLERLFDDLNECQDQYTWEADMDKLKEEE
jgi:hypothetical protein